MTYNPQISSSLLRSKGNIVELNPAHFIFIFHKHSPQKNIMFYTYTLNTRKNEVKAFLRNPIFLRPSYTPNLRGQCVRNAIKQCDKPKEKRHSIRKHKYKIS